ncbi:biopolymer transporter ExbD [cf. Phormidesmis sp. LEGE 11477]|uniref:ExbD/TolR family protein n=1 Tax=cf. Phormidesmis sp. LEGE 11477 TaxID=1828680 RepID=UPI00187FA6FC|nr:biopolymer transporter ExbD [cf. Phormidesmis sp. LEGE 11477]MBE9059642.1 biopolymer transporter ExbD [cf. Phormidesmis sp. LEGE 11477]
MRFRHTEDNGIPTIDLIPMLTVMMGVLAFFVVVSVSLGSEELIQVDLPPEQTEETPNDTDSVQDPFVVEMDETGQRLLNGNPIEPETLAIEIESYLAQNADSIVYLIPSRQLPYEQVVQFLGDMRAVGGERVSLALREDS